MCAEAAGISGKPQKSETAVNIKLLIGGFYDIMGAMKKQIILEAIYVIDE